MNEVVKTVTASFETIDLAELACRNIKQKYDNINAISIRYKNVPHQRHNYHSVSDNEDSKAPIVTGTTALGGISAPLGNALNGAITPVGTIFAGENVSDDGSLIDNSTPEIHRSLESKVIVKTNSSNAENISHTLRGLGGQNISVK